MRPQPRPRTGAAAAEVLLLAGLALLFMAIMLGTGGIFERPTAQSDGSQPRLPPSPLFELAYNSRNHSIIVRGLNGHLAQLSLDGRPIDTVPSCVPGHVMSLACNADGSTLITGRLDGTLVVESTAVSDGRMQVLEGHEKPIVALAISPDGRQFASGDSRGNVRIWDFEACTAGRMLSAHGGQVASLCWLPDGRLLSAGADGVARLWDMAHNKPIREFIGHRGQILTSSVSIDGRQVATGGSDGTLRLWDVETATERWKHTVPGGDYIGAVAFAPDCRSLVCGTFWSENNLRQFDRESGRVIQAFRGHSSSIRCLQFLGNGTQLVSTGFDGSVRLWDVRSWQLLRVMQCSI